MPLNPNIAGTIRAPDIFGALQRGIESERAVRQAPILEAMQQQQLAQNQFALDQAPILAAQQQQEFQQGQKLFELESTSLQANNFLAAQKQKILAATTERDRRKEVAKLQSNLLRQAGRLETTEEREAFRQSLDPQLLLDSGLDPQVIANLPLDDQSIRNSIAQSEAIFGGAEDGKQVLEIRKEVRSSIGKEVGAIKKEASVINANFSKLQNLSKGILKGNRSAVSQALVALVKLGDPGSIVNASEMLSALNNKTPLAAITGLLAGKGVSDDVTQSIASKIDPLDPSNVNVADLLSTATALVQANVPSIQNRFASEQERAGENLTEQGIRSIFSQKTLDTISGLSDLQVEQTPASPTVNAAPTIGQPFDIGGVTIRRVK